MKMDDDNCHFLISGNKHEQMWVKRGGETIWESHTVHFWVMTIDYDPKFEKHV